MSLLINPRFRFIVHAASRSYKYRRGHLLTLSLGQGHLFTSVNQSETCN